MAIERIPPLDPSTLRPLTNWCKQTVLFSIMVRARDRGEPLADQHVPEAYQTAERVCQESMTKAGAIVDYQSVQAWMAAVVDNVLRWVQQYLGR